MKRVGANLPIALSPTLGHARVYSDHSGVTRCELACYRPGAAHAQRAGLDYHARRPGALWPGPLKARVKPSWLGRRQRAPAQEA